MLLWVLLWQGSEVDIKLVVWRVALWQRMRAAAAAARGSRKRVVVLVLGCVQVSSVFGRSLS
jgi:hypothetical protein